MYKPLFVLILGTLFLGQTPEVKPQVKVENNHLMVEGWGDLSFSLYGEEGCVLDTIVSPPVFIPPNDLPMGRYLLVVSNVHGDQELFKLNHELKTN